MSTRLVEAGYDVTLYVSAPDPKGAGWRSTDAVGAVRGRLAPEVELEFLPYSAVQRGPGRVPAQPAARPAARPPPSGRPVRAVDEHPDPHLGAGAAPAEPAGALPGHRARARVRLDEHEPAGDEPSSSGSSATCSAPTGAASWCTTGTTRRSSAGPTACPDDRVVVTGGCGVDPAEFPFTDLRPRPRAPRPDQALTPACRSSWCRCACSSTRASSTPPRRRGASTADGRDPRDVVHLEPRSDATRPRSPPTTSTASRGRSPARALPRLPGQPGRPLPRRATSSACPTYFPEGLPDRAAGGGIDRSPIVTCDNVGGRDFVRDGIDGIVVPPRYPDAAGRRARRLLTEPERRRAACAAAPTPGSSQGYTKQAMLDLTVEAIEELGFPARRPSTSRMSRCAP